MLTNRSLILFFSMLIATPFGCASPDSSVRERAMTTQHAFESKESVLVDFDIDGSLLADTAEPAVVRTLIQAQLLYGVGVLNGDRSLGRYERLELSAINATPKEGTASFQVTYRAKLPVAWGLPAQPASYTLPLPARVGRADQVAFAKKYGKSCVDPTAGEIGAADAGRMFLNYRPLRAGCVLDAADVVSASATISASTENTTGKYPEYHRIWEDGALDVVALFSHSSYERVDDDFGGRAYEDFVARLDAYLAERQPDATKRSAESPRASAARRAATLPDGRTVRIDVSLVGAQLAHEGPELNAWYDGLTPEADVILYSGHADLGENVRTLMTMGTFVPGKYVLWIANACDTFAYVDRTLADRRRVLNPDDVHGTKYMDTVSTVLGGYFGTGPNTALSFLDAVAAARDATSPPKTYRQIFAEVDPEQITVVTGEEDNEFVPAMFSPGADGSGLQDPGPAGGAPSAMPPADAQPQADEGSCSAGRGMPAGGIAGIMAFGCAIAAALRRLRRRT